MTQSKSSRLRNYARLLESGKISKLQLVEELGNEIFKIRPSTECLYYILMIDYALPEDLLTHLSVDEFITYLYLISHVQATTERKERAKKHK